MIFRVKIEVGYQEVYFDFRESCQAVEFLKRGAQNYNSKLSDTSKFSMTMCILNDEEDK